MRLAADSYLANLKTAMNLYTVGMSSEENDTAIWTLLEQTSDAAIDICERKMNGRNTQ